MELPPTEQTISRWTLDQLKVGLIFREQTFAEGSTKQELFDQLMAWNTATFPIMTRPSGRKRAATKIQNQDEFIQKRGKRGEMPPACERPAKATSDDKDEEADTATRGTNCVRTKAKPATAPQPPLSASCESESRSGSEKNGFLMMDQVIDWFKLDRICVS